MRLCGKFLELYFLRRLTANIAKVRVLTRDVNEMPSKEKGAAATSETILMR
jgi:hypothetical protein